MDKKLVSVLVALVVVLAIFAGVMFGLGATQTPLGPFTFSVDQATLLMRFVFVVLGLLIVFAVYFVTRDNKAWEVGTREVVYMAIGAALYAIFSYLFNGTVFVVPSLGGGEGGRGGHATVILTGTDQGPRFPRRVTQRAQ